MGERRPLYLHLGLQKTGTSYLQAALLASAPALARDGLDLVPATKKDAFELMLQVRDRYHEGRDPVTVQTALERFSAALGSASGDRALYSQESLAAARPAQVRRLLGACAEREVHVVLTVRDLARQIPSMWQQELKAGRTESYGDFLERLRTAQREGRGTHPWIHLDPPAVLARWAAHVPAERIHVVTVPRPGSDPDLLLRRFCQVVGVDPGVLTLPERAANTSLGRSQAEVLRLVNGHLPPEVLRRQVYGDVGKRYFAATILAGQDAAAIRLPDDLRAWCEQVSADQVAALRDAGYDVVGTLDDLLVTAAGPETGRTAEEADEGDVAPAQVLDAAVEALASLLVDHAAARPQRAKGHRPRRLRRWFRR